MRQGFQRALRPCNCIEMTDTNENKDKHRVSLPEDLLFHRGHTWLRREHHEMGDRFRVGLDGLFLADIGAVEILDLPYEGDEISQDEVCGLVRGKNGKRLLYAPLSGEILEVNVELHEDPDVIRDDPYGIGWILLVDPSDPAEELDYLMSGEAAQEWWEIEIELRRLGSSSP